MVVSGKWRIEEDGIARPMVDVMVTGADGDPVTQLFLVDTGADCTVFSAQLLAKLAKPAEEASGCSILQGLGGQSESVAVEGTLEIHTTDGRELKIRGKFAAVVQPSMLDISVLGRDVLANFDVIVSRRRNEVLLVAGNHSYAVTG
jgi:predicted aspartyl protease